MSRRAAGDVQADLATRESRVTEDPEFLSKEVLEWLLLCGAMAG
jgi:hypothetical protein